MAVASLRQDSWTPDAGVPHEPWAAREPREEIAAEPAAQPGASVAEPEIAQLAIGRSTLIAADPEMLRIYERVQRLARTPLPILLAGESGVGKDHAALAIHAWSGRGDGPFVTVHCAAMQEALIEGELFGYERGAFFGAVAGKPGVLERAHGGTLFLDEIDALSAVAQARLLRLLEEPRVTRLGGTQERTLDVRIIAATRVDLSAEIDAGRFRRDLYFRLSGALVVLPPLRARPREIPALAQHFLDAARARGNGQPVEIGPAAIARLVAHTWTGNLRELRHAMGYAAALVDRERVEPWHLPEAVAGVVAGMPAGPSSTATAPAAPAAEREESQRFRPIAEELRALERRRMAEALRATGGVQRRAAKLIGMPVRTFTCKLTQYGLRDRARPE